MSKLRQIHPPAGRRLASLSLAAVALLATVLLGALSASASGIFVRGNGEAEVVVQGPSHSLRLYTATSANSWHPFQVTGMDSTFSAPSIFVNGGQTDVVAEGPNNSLMYYWATCLLSGCWHRVQIAGMDSTYSAPSIFVGGGQTDVVAEGPNNSLTYYWATCNAASCWHRTQAASSTYSAPSIVVRPSSEVDVVAEGPNNSLLFSWATPPCQVSNCWHHAQVAPGGSTFSAPSISFNPFQAGAVGADDVAAEGPANSLRFYWAKATCTVSVCWHPRQVAAGGSTFAAPSLSLSAKGAVELAAEGPNNSLRYYYAMAPTSPWHPALLGMGGSTFCAPSIFVRAFHPEGQADVVAQAPNHSLRYYWADNNTIGPPTLWHTVQVAAGGSAYC